MNNVQSAFDALRKETEQLFKDSDVNSLINIVLYNGLLTYVPSEFRAGFRVETVVRWASPVGPFTISALGISPFDAVQINSRPAPQYGDLHVAQATVPSTIARGTYHYAIALFDGSKIYLDPACPPIIVE